MSHSVVLVCLSPSEDGVINFDQLETKLAPFNENISVDPYMCPCFCVGLKAHNESREAAWKELGYTLEDLRSAYWAIPEAIRSDEIWNVMLKPFELLRDAKIESHALKDKPNHECDECQGTGEYETTYNPKSRWDWYSIGGRWDGYLAEKSIPLYPSKDYEGNVALTSDIAKAIKSGVGFFAALTPDGEWHERGKMGWWGMISGEKDKDDWNTELAKTLEALPDGTVAVLVDVHI